MFEYFEDNYVWNMAVNLALAMGGSIGDIDDVSRELKPLAKYRDDASAERFFTAWTGLGAKLKRLAAADEARGRSFSAGAKYRRAFIYYIQAERMQRPTSRRARAHIARRWIVSRSFSSIRSRIAGGSRCRT